MISCKQATEYIIKKEEGKLSAKQDLQMQPHLAICSMCRLFEEQSSLINKAVANHNPKVDNLSISEKEELSKAVQSRIKQK